MLVFAGFTFIITLGLISTLFALRVREFETGRYLAPKLRSAADVEARRLKELLVAAHMDIKKIPPLLVYWAHVVIHFAALEFARAARVASLSAHAFANFVSSNRHFQRKQTQSELLKKMNFRKPSLPVQNGQILDESLKS